ncbi:hypothetical protein VHEMI09087 [[Torrubiella] hemipterigena]|uniref:Dimethylaniline monooxygenase n=1 Tax=[Torrubiella] hemipterigena TaxID=1531966 RepID=A0A0A1TPE0_9HYPO|nr:hypothetical protein VHEMI09087 [[Torrubiella] hemipterigena]
MSESYDIVVVGAGWYGLAAARACAHLISNCKIAILERGESCGGTWSKNRLYPGLRSNNMFNTFEYPDFPMLGAKYNVGSDEHIPGPAIHDYLTDFAKHFDLLGKIQFNVNVDSAENLGDNGWELAVTGLEGAKRVVTARKLIVATGLTSVPNMPHYKNAESFEAPIFHVKDFGKRSRNGDLEGNKNTVVVGGAKSAFDIAYSMVEAGSTVDIVIRDSGNGPAWMAPSFVTPLKKRLDFLLSTRLLTWFSPCPWGPEDGYSRIRRFLHGTAVGRFIVDSFWKILEGDVTTSNGYDDQPETRMLKPWNAAFWFGGGLGILNHGKNWFDLVKSGKIRVHIGQVDHLEKRAVLLADGTTLSADAIICATGWKKVPSIQLLGGTTKTSGILELDRSPEDLKLLKTRADNEILASFPRLKDQPKSLSKEPASAPPRLYRFMVPPAKLFQHTIAFVGFMSTATTGPCAYAQALWVAAYFRENVDRMPRSEDEAIRDTMLHTQWGKWRHPTGYGASIPDFVFDGVPYMDMLYRDLGLNSHRKKGWMSELVSPYLPADYAGLLDEWEAKNL